MTSRGAATALSKLTWAIGIAFVVTSLTLTVLAAHGSRSGSIVDTIGTTAPASGTATDTPTPAMPGLEGDLLPKAPVDEVPAAPPPVK